MISLRMFMSIKTFQIKLLEKLHRFSATFYEYHEWFFSKSHSRIENFKKKLNKKKQKNKTSVLWPRRSWLNFTSNHGQL